MKMPQVFVRDTYIEFADAIKQDKRNIIVEGNPGIGKSFFGVFLLRMLILDHVSVLYVRGGKGFYFPRTGNPVLYKIGESNMSTLPTYTCFLLFDCLSGENVMECTGYPKVVVLSSPHISNFKDLNKDGAHQYIMPPWSLSELKALSKSTFPNILPLVEDRFETVGGIPRYIFEDQFGYDTLLQRRKGEISECSFKTSFSSTSSGILSSKGSHLLFHHFSKVKKRNIDHVDYASHKTGIEVSAAIVHRSVKGGVELLKEACRYFQHNSIPGYLFENLAHYGLESGISFKTKQLQANSTGDDTSFKLENYTRSDVGIFANLTEVDNKVYYVPLEERCPSYDSFVFTSDHVFITFQMTITHNRSAGSMEGFNELSEKFNAHVIKHYWVVPEHAYSSYKKARTFPRTSLQIEQYCLLLDCTVLGQ